MASAIRPCVTSTKRWLSALRVGVLVACMVGSAGCGGGGGGNGGSGGSPGGPVSPSGPTGPGGPGGPQTSPVADLALTVAASVEVGQGIISPYRLATDERRADRMFVLTGRGESFPEARLHVVEPAGLADLAPPIDIGSNGADFVQDGDHLLVAVRGSSRLSLIDAAGWRKLQDLPLGFPPAAITALGNGEFVVASVSDGSVAVVRRTADRIDIARRATLDTFAYDVTADPATQRVYLSQPLRGVQVLDGSTLAAIRTVALPGEPSRGIALWRGHVLVANRDGYLHVLSPDGAIVQVLDVAAALGLDRATLPSRGIDPGDLVDLGDGRFALVNNRQDSLLLEGSSTSAVPVRVTARMRSGAFGSYRAAERVLYLTLPSINAVTKVTVPLQPPSTGLLPETRLTVGAEIVGAAPLQGGAALAVLTSRGVLGLYDASGRQTAEFRPATGDSWLPPLVATTGGGMALVARRGTGVEDLLHLDRSGAVIGTHRIDVGPVFAAFEKDGTAVLVSRLNRTLQFVDLSSAQKSVLPLQRDRPRIVARTGQDTWIVLHDTTPDIGITLVRGGQEAGFHGFDDWFTGLVDTVSRGPVTASFNGSLAVIGADGRIGSVRRSSLQSLSDLRPGTGDTVWATAENLGEAYRIRVADLAVDGRYRRSGIRRVGALPESNLLYSTTARHVELLRE